MRDPRAEGNLTVVVPILSGKHEAELRTLLDKLGDDVLRDPDLPVTDLSTVHFMRWVVVPGYKHGDVVMAPASLVLSTNYDPPLARHLDELVTRGGKKLDEIYQHCEGYPPVGSRGRDAVIGFLRDHTVRSQCFYVGHPWRTRHQILEEAKLRRDLESELDDLAAAGQLANRSPRELYDHLRDVADRRHDAPEVSYLPPPRPALAFLFGLALLGWALFFLVMSPFILLTALAILVHERLDARHADEDADAAHARMRVQHQADREDYLVQNQLTHLVELKPGLARAIAVRVVLRLIGTLARYYYNRGRLGDIPTIHFARWVLIDRGTRVLFFSNYDGSWESYLGDFVDKAAKGLSGIWSNTIGFPVTKALVWRGAKDEQRFKTWARAQQIRTQVWYSAYPDLSVRNILHNTEVRRGLVVPLADDEVEAWLRKL